MFLRRINPAAYIRPEFLPMDKIYTRLNMVAGTSRSRLALLKGSVLSPLYWLLARIRGGCGLRVHCRVAAMGFDMLARGGGGVNEAYNLAFFPMDSARYFEFDILWQWVVEKRPEGRYLDVSSPRNFPALVLRDHKHLVGDLVNPDGQDLSLTMRLMEQLGLLSRCRLHQKKTEEISFPDNTFELITCISVVEHIPDGGDLGAVETLWRLLAPGGRLLVTVPCASRGFAEYIDYNEYGLLQRDENGFVFGQTFYDDEALRERIFTITGFPVRSAVFGEVEKGLFFRNRERKLKDPTYPFWREPYMMATEYSRFHSIKDLPGVGIIAMEFRKT